MVKKKISVRMRGVKPNFNWFYPKQKIPENWSALDLAMVTEDVTDVFAKSAGARAYFRMILPPERPSWWRRLIMRKKGGRELGLLPEVPTNVKMEGVAIMKDQPDPKAKITHIESTCETKRRSEK